MPVNLIKEPIYVPTFVPFEDRVENNLDSSNRAWVLGIWAGIVILAMLVMIPFLIADKNAQNHNEELCEKYGYTYAAACPFTN